jgi:asparagine synthase (glutamine-hydrolysing)
MCGIAGLVQRPEESVDRDLLRRMTDILAHRGPDGEGFFVHGPVGLGHRRLAIIDLSSGAQPMASSEGALNITYNGELYNFRELRQELAAIGQQFRTNSDTEVLLAAYEAWGVDCLARLRGMFAFAIWDQRRGRLFAARDRTGIKPFVYSWHGGRFRFASEIKALLEDPTLPRDLERDAIAEYFTYTYIPSPATIFRHIRKLPPASYLLYSPGWTEPEVHGYWELRMDPAADRSVEDWVESVRAGLRSAVESHLVSDVPVGAFLSGGLDSSSVVATMAHASRAPVKTFSIGFEEAAFDELAYARLVAAKYGTDHFELIVKPDVVNVLPRLAWQFDEPFADASAIPTYCVAKITRDHVTVALSGDGGDESFAGYRRHAEAARMHDWADSTPLAMLKPLMRILGRARGEGARGKAFFETLGMDRIERYHRLMTFERPDGLRRLLCDDVFPGEGARVTPRFFHDLVRGVDADDYVSQMQQLDIRHYLPEDILTKVDRTSMLTALETRVPLLDHVFMEEVARIPSALKLRKGEGKYIFKEAMRPSLPEAVVTRRKMGFGVPLGKWLRNELRDLTWDVLCSPRARQRGMLRGDAVERLLSRHSAGGRDYSAQVWSVLCFELWCRTWVDR